MSKICCYLIIGGSEGLFAQKTLEITDDILQTYKNQGRLFDEVIAVICRIPFITSNSDILVLKCMLQGGYDLLGRTKDQIRTTEQVNAALKACTDLKLDGLVIIGGT